MLTFAEELPALDAAMFNKLNAPVETLLSNVVGDELGVGATRVALGAEACWLLGSEVIGS